MTRRCSVCGEAAFSGRRIDYEYRGGWKQDIEGEFVDGAGQCESCGKYFCADHNELSGGACPGCREEEESGYIPF